MLSSLLKSHFFSVKSKANTADNRNTFVVNEDERKTHAHTHTQNRLVVIVVVITEVIVARGEGGMDRQLKRKESMPPLPHLLLRLTCRHSVCAQSFIIVYQIGRQGDSNIQICLAESFEDEEKIITDSLLSLVP